MLLFSYLPQDAESQLVTILGMHPHRHHLRPYPV